MTDAFCHNNKKDLNWNKIITLQNFLFNQQQPMGCTACTEICSNQKNVLKPNSDFLQIAKNKVMFMRKTFSTLEQKKFLQDYFTEEQLTMMLRHMSLQQVFRPENILRPEAGQQFYLSEARRTLWKLYSFDIMVHQYTKNPLIHQFKYDFKQIQLSPIAEQRFYQISLDINRTFPLVKNLNKDHLSLVLKNLTLFFDGVGYTQGMNFVVGFLLLCGFGPKQAYWMFIHLSFNKNFLLIRNFSEGFKNAMFMIKVFEEVMSRNQKLHNLKIKLETMGLTGFIYSFSWFLCFFLYSLQPKCCVLVWDYLLTFNNKPENVQKTQPLNSTKNAMNERTQLEMEQERKNQSNPEYFSNIINHRGSITSLIYLACELMLYLEDHIHECEGPEQLMKTFRNQSLIKKITPQTVMNMIQNIKNYHNFSQQKQKKIDGKMLESIMKAEDKELYEIYLSSQGHKKFIQETLGLTRPVARQMKASRIKVVTHLQN